MTTNDIIAEIRDANLGYLMLAQQMIRSDKATAIFRLGISNEIADLIEGMNNAQILKLAGANMMLARFRFDDGAILGMLTNYNNTISSGLLKRFVQPLVLPSGWLRANAQASGPCCNWSACRGWRRHRNGNGPASYWHQRA